VDFYRAPCPSRLTLNFGQSLRQNRHAEICLSPHRDDSREHTSYQGIREQDNVTFTRWPPEPGRQTPLPRLLCPQRVQFSARRAYVRLEADAVNGGGTSRSSANCGRISGTTASTGMARGRQRRQQRTGGSGGGDGAVWWSRWKRDWRRGRPVVRCAVGGGP